MSRKERVSQPLSDHLFDIVTHLILSVFMLICLYPILFVLIASISNPNEVLAGHVILWPVDIRFSGYAKVFSDQSIWISYRNTIVYTVLGSALNIAATMTGAYVLSRPRFPGKKLFAMMITITMFFSAGLIPSYFVYKALGIIDTMWVMIIPGLISPYNLIIARTFIHNNIGQELYEAANIDGCDHFRYYVKIVLPLSITTIAVLTLYYAVGHWNSYFNALVFIQNQNLFPLQMTLRRILIQNTFSSMDMSTSVDLDDQAVLNLSEQIKYALIVVSTVPILTVYPFLQKYFVTGVMIGAIKG